MFDASSESLAPSPNFGAAVRRSNGSFRRRPFYVVDMEAVLWYVLTGTRGGPNRVRILRAIDDRPRNANQLAEELDLDYTTIRHHLDVLREHDVVERTGDGYGTVYYPTERTQRNWDLVEEIAEDLT